jgi:general secretion pathway protein C
MDMTMRRYLWAANLVIVCLCVTMLGVAVQSAVGAGKALASLHRRPPPAAPGAVGTRAFLAQTGEHSYQVSRAFLEQAFHSDPGLSHLSRSTRIVPELREGRTLGLRIFSLQPDSALALLGFKGSDILRTVNGLSLSSPERALEAYGHLRDAIHVTVGVERDGKPLALDYWIL